MAKENNNPSIWIKGELKLAESLDRRIIDLLNAIGESGSLNQAAKQVGLSYKGAWQIIERTNNSSPKTLVETVKGGTRGGGTVLTDEGRALIALFEDLEQQHQNFLKQLNQKLTENVETVLLLQRLEVKTSARNQLFGRVFEIKSGVINVEIAITLKGGEQIIITISRVDFDKLGLAINSEAVMLINSEDILLIPSTNLHQFSARNCLTGIVIQIEQNTVNSEVILLLAGGEMLVATITESDLQNLNVEIGTSVLAIFKANAPILGVKI